MMVFVQCQFLEEKWKDLQIEQKLQKLTEENFRIPAETDDQER